MPFVVEIRDMPSSIGRYDEERKCATAEEVGTQVEDLSPLDAEDVAESVADEGLRGEVYRDEETGMRIFVHEVTS